MRSRGFRWFFSGTAVVALALSWGAASAVSAATPQGAAPAKPQAASASKPQAAPAANPQPATAPAGGAMAQQPAEPAPKYSKVDQKLLDDLAKIGGKPLTDDQKIQILKAARDYKAIVRAGKTIFDDRVSKALAMTTEELHTREKKVRHDDEMKRQAEIDKEAATPIQGP